jgi:hypothetical protein
MTIFLGAVVADPFRVHCGSLNGILEAVTGGPAAVIQAQGQFPRARADALGRFAHLNLPDPPT